MQGIMCIKWRHYFCSIPDIVKFPVKPTATLFVPIAFEPASSKSQGIPATSPEDCVIRCHEDPLCGALLYSRQADSLGNNCHLFQKRTTN